MTAFLALVFVLMLSFIGGIMESASLQMAKNYRRADMDRAIESVFAEYQKELLQEFNIFGLEGSYESGTYSEQMILERLKYYGANGIDNQIQALRVLTDNNGSLFREQAARYIESRHGTDFTGELIGETDAWERQNKEIAKIEEFAKSQEINLENLLAGNEVSLPVENNPLHNIQVIKSKPLLELVMPEGRVVSEGVVELEDLPSFRECNVGVGEFSNEHIEKDIGALAFGEYLLKHFTQATEESANAKGAIQYELEYILSGEESDKENLNKVIKKLLLIRMVSNYGFVSSNTEKRTEAEAMALALSTAVLLPEISNVIAQVLLLAWAFGESVIDLRSLLEGKKVPLVKTAEYWQLSLTSLSTLGTESDRLKGKENEQGLSYKEYLRILLFLEEKIAGSKIITLRALDMVEKRLRFDRNLDWFRIDNCVSRIEIKSTCNLRRGISYQFKTYYGYQ